METPTITEFLERVAIPQMRYLESLGAEIVGINTEGDTLTIHATYECKHPVNVISVSVERKED